MMCRKPIAPAVYPMSRFWCESAWKKNGDRRNSATATRRGMDATQTWGDQLRTDQRNASVRENGVQLFHCKLQLIAVRIYWDDSKTPLQYHIADVS